MVILEKDPLRHGQPTSTSFVKQNPHLLGIPLGESLRNIHQTYRSDMQWISLILQFLIDNVRWPLQKDFLLSWQRERIPYMGMARSEAFYCIRIFCVGGRCARMPLYNESLHGVGITTGPCYVRISCVDG